MGKRSNLVLARRAQAGQMTQGMQQTREQRLREFAAAKENDPALKAQAEASLASEWLQDRNRADYPGQRDRLRRAGWVQAWVSPLGAGGWAHVALNLQMMHGLHREEDGSYWSHASITFHKSNALPTWEMLRDLHWLLYPELAGVQVIAPPSKHFSIGEVIHAWTRLDAPTVPDFGKHGTI